MSESSPSEEPRGLPASASLNRLDVTPLLALLLFALAICWPVVLGKVPIASNTLALWAPWSQFPHDPIQNTTLADSAHLYLSWTVYARDAIHNGEWPMWDPNSFSGFPFAANSQTQVYYPLSWLLWLLPLSVHLQFLAILSIVLAGWGMYFFTRALGASRAGALIAGLAFSGSGMAQTAVDVPGVLSAYGWLPWMLGTADLALRLRSSRWTAAAALCCGLQAVAGHLQWAIYAYFALGCWLLFRTVQLTFFTTGLAERAGQLRYAVLQLGRSALILAAGPLLALVHLAPFVELTTLAGRTGVRTSSNSDPFFYLLRLLMPNIFGTPLVIPNFPLGSSNLWYLGLLPLALAVASLWSPRRAVVLFWLGIALFAILVTYGIGPFLYVRWLPGLQATLPVRIGFLLIAGLSVPAAIGFDTWISLVGRSRPALFALMSVVLLFPLAAGWLGLALNGEWLMRGLPEEFHAQIAALQRDELLRGSALALVTLLALTGALLSARQPYLRRAVLFLPAVVLAADLLTAVPGYTPYVSPSEVVPLPPSLTWLQEQLRQSAIPWRVMGLGGTETDPSVPVLVPNSQLLAGLQSVGGYDSLHPSTYDDFWNLTAQSTGGGAQRGPYANVFVRPQAYTSTLASLLSVRYIASGQPITATGFSRVYDKEISIYKNARALPRAFVVAHAELLDPREALRRMAASDFDPTQQVFIDKDQHAASIPAEALSPQQAPRNALSQATISAYRRNEVTIRVSAFEPAWLVLADTNYPGWHAVVDGKEQPVFTADHILRAVYLQQGSHTVRFWFQPSFFLPSLVISGLSLLLTLSALAWPRRT